MFRFLNTLRIGAALLTVCLAWSVGVQAQDMPETDDELLEWILEADREGTAHEKYKVFDAWFQADYRTLPPAAPEALIYLSVMSWMQTMDQNLASWVASGVIEPPHRQLFRLLVHPRLSAPLTLTPDKELMAALSTADAQARLSALMYQRYDQPPDCDTETSDGSSEEGVTVEERVLLRLNRLTCQPVNTKRLDPEAVIPQDEFMQYCPEMKLTILQEKAVQIFQKVLRSMEQWIFMAPENAITAILYAFLAYQSPGGGLWLADRVLEHRIQRLPEDQQSGFRQRLARYRYKLYSLAQLPYPGHQSESVNVGWNLLPGADAAEPAVFVDTGQQQAYEQQQREAWAFAEDLGALLDPLANPERLTEGQRQHLKEAEALTQDLKPMLMAFDGGEGLSAEQQQRVESARAFAEGLGSRLTPFASPESCSSESCPDATAWERSDILVDPSSKPKDWNREDSGQ